MASASRSSLLHRYTCERLVRLAKTSPLLFLMDISPTGSGCKRWPARATVT